MRTPPLCPSSVVFSLAVATSQTFTVPSQHVESRYLPSGEKVTPNTRFLCPSSDAFSLPVSRSHSLTSPGTWGWEYSPVQDASSLPSGEKAAVQTRAPCPSSTTRFLPDGQSWTLTDFSSRASAICLPSLEKATEKTMPLGGGSKSGCCNGPAAPSGAGIDR